MRAKYWKYLSNKTRKMIESLDYLDQVYFWSMFESQIDGRVGRAYLDSIERQAKESLNGFVDDSSPTPFKDAELTLRPSSFFTRSVVS